MLDLVYQILADDTTVTDVCGDRIYPEYRDPGSNVPAVMIDLNAMSSLNTMSTTSKADTYRMKVYALAQGVGAAVSFGRKVRAALEGQRGTFGMPDGYTYYLASTRVENFDVDTDYDGRTAAIEIELEMDVITEAATLGPGPNYPDPNPSLNDLTDVTTPAPSNGEVLTYNGSTETWTAVSPSAGSNLRTVTEFSTSYTASAGDDILHAALIASSTLTLPDATATPSGTVFVVKDAGGNTDTYTLTIETNGGTMDGNSSVEINTPYTSLSFYCDSSNYYIL